MVRNCRAFWSSEEGQDIAEYAVVLAVILVIIIGAVRLIGGKREQCVFQRCQQHPIGRAVLKDRWQRCALGGEC